MISEKNISVYKLAAECSLPYTTVNELVLGKKNPEQCNYRTLSALARFFGLSIEDFVKKTRGKSAIPALAYNGSWNDAKKLKYRFPVKYSAEAYDASRIHPLKQSSVLSVWERVKDLPELESLVLFGSAPTICCNGKSDLDFAVKLKPGRDGRGEKNLVSEAIQEACGYNADIIWMDSVDKDSQLYKNITGGVRII